MMTRVGFSTLIGAAVCSLGWFCAPAFAQNQNPAGLLSKSSSLLREQQEIESKLAASQAKLQTLQSQQKLLQGEAGENQTNRAVNQENCQGSSYYWHRGDCDLAQQQLSSREQNIQGRQGDVTEQIRSTSAEIEQLTNRRNQLMRQGESMDEQLKRLEFSGVTQECVGQQPSSGLQDRVSAYERCWDGTTADKPRFRPETSNVPSLSHGPIEQMGIEDEKRRRRKARQKELSGE
jgi:uncharacterized protein YlxW (UPF0749 family)